MRARPSRRAAGTRTASVRVAARPRGAPATRPGRWRRREETGEAVRRSSALPRASSPEALRPEGPHRVDRQRAQEDEHAEQRVPSGRAAPSASRSCRGEGEHAHGEECQSGDVVAEVGPRVRGVGSLLAHGRVGVGRVSSIISTDGVRSAGHFGWNTRATSPTWRAGSSCRAPAAATSRWRRQDGTTTMTVSAEEERNVRGALPGRHRRARRTASRLPAPRTRAAQSRNLGERERGRRTVPTSPSTCRRRPRRAAPRPRRPDHRAERQPPRKRVTTAGHSARTGSLRFPSRQTAPRCTSPRRPTPRRRAGATPSAPSAVRGARAGRRRARATRRCRRREGRAAR